MCKSLKKLLNFPSIINGVYIMQAKQENSITLDVFIYLEGIHSILLLQSKAMEIIFIKALVTLFLL